MAGRGRPPPAAFAVPTIDVSAFEGADATASDDVVRRVKEACERVGFFVVINHGVSDARARDAMAAARGFFARPLEEKMKIASLKKGYIPVGGCDNAVRPTNMHEKYSCSRVDGVDAVSDPYYDASASPDAALYFGEQNRWPESPSGFREAWEEYYRTMETLASRLMRMFALALGADAHHFETRIDKHVTNLVALRYPPLDLDLDARADADADEGPDETIVERVKPHTDPTTLTILAFETGEAGGLQVLPDRRGDGGDASGSDTGAEVDEWIDVPSVAGGLLVNLGDVMRFWTNDAWKATRHRVVARRETLALDRLSLIFFHMPNYDAVVDAGDFGAAVVNDARPRKYPAFKSGERSHFNQLMRDEEGLPDRQTLKEGTNARGD